MKKFQKVFGAKKPNKANKFIEATTWDGKDKVTVVYPDSPSVKIKKLVTDFLLSELDDHDALDEFKKKEKISQKELESYFKN